jgi:dolichol-phosphate mannosyltransferase
MHEPMHEPGAAADASRFLSVVVPVRDEADNVAPLAREIVDVLAGVRPFEIIFVDDASTDRTVRNIRALRQASVPQVRLLRHCVGCGQSIAVQTGVRAARGEWIVTLDGDGQNDPADIPVLLQVLEQDGSPGDLRLIVGNRKSRRDTWLRRVSSRIANGVRRRMLRDGTPDTGCGIKLFHRETFLQLPAFNHMHRFMPALFQRAGARVMSVEVRHRPRTHGRSKYGLSNRLWVGIVDLFGVRWLIRRAPLRTAVTEE